MAAARWRQPTAAPSGAPRARGALSRSQMEEALGSITQQFLDLHDAASRGASDEWERALRAVGACAATEIASLEGELAACRSELAASREAEGSLTKQLARSAETCSNLRNDYEKLNRQIARMKGQAAIMADSRPSMCGAAPSPCASPVKGGTDAPRAALGCVSPSSRNRGAAGFGAAGADLGAASPGETVAYFESVLAGTRSDSTGSSLERLTKRLLEAEGAPTRPSSPPTRPGPSSDLTPTPSLPRRTHSTCVHAHRLSRRDHRRIRRRWHRLDRLDAPRRAYRRPVQEPRQARGAHERHAASSIRRGARISRGRRQALRMHGRLAAQTQEGFLRHELRGAHSECRRVLQLNEGGEV